MRGRDLEATLASLGASVTSLDAITRELRAHKVIPVGGRGPHAPQIDHGVAAWMLAALAGSDVPSQAGRQLARLGSLRRPAECSRISDEFIDALRIVLGNATLARDVREIRVSRNLDLARIVYSDGTIERFIDLSAVDWDDADGLGSASFLSEGVLTGGLLHQIAIDFLQSDEGELADAAWEGER